MNVKYAQTLSRRVEKHVANLSLVVAMSLFIHVKAFAMKESVNHVLTHRIFIVGVASKKRKSHVLSSEIKLLLHSCVTSDATRKDHVDDTSVMKFAVWTQNISVLWFVVVNSIVGFIDVKNPVIGAVVKHAGKQVLTS